MSIGEAMLVEFDHETATTRSLLELLPEDKAAWRPHARSMSLGELAMHLSSIPGWAATALKERGFDTNPPGGPPMTRPPFESVAIMLNGYDDGVKAARALLLAASDEELLAGWTLKSGGRPLFSMPRLAVFRSFIMNHTIHHRGQLSVYLRLCDVPLPSIYGPSADTQGA
jgi:uncharacterized damage-inducible protein DinB